jgi:hypothetical protein
MSVQDITNWIVISDFHFGCQLGLCPPTHVRLDEGGHYQPNIIQRKMWNFWDEFCNVWIPTVTRNEEYGIIINGDIIDGVHHSSTHQISHNLTDQKNIAMQVLEPIIAKCNGALYITRGTEAHSGPSARVEEDIAKQLKAIPNKVGQYSRYDLWKRLGSHLIHIMHHIGTTTSSAYESTAVNRELVDSYNEAARWGERAPSIIIRSHRHRHIKVSLPSDLGDAIAEVTPGWQAKTPFTFRIAGARLAPPQFGGIVIRLGDEEIYTRSFVKTIGRSDIEP